MDDLNKLINDPVVVCIFVIVAFAGFAVFKYVRKVYYSFDGIDSSNNILNSRFHFDRMRDIVDEDAINKELFLVDLCSIIISSLVMILISPVWGIFSLIAVSAILNNVWSLRLGSKYLKIRSETPAPVKAPRKERRAKERAERKKSQYPDR